MSGWAVTGGLVHDGMGSPPARCDLLIDNGRIVAIETPGTLDAFPTFDATGCTITPGLINLVSYAGPRLGAGGSPESDMLQGVTLEVCGEGGSLYPMDGFAGHSDVADAFRARPPAVNVATIVDIGTIAEHVGPDDARIVSAAEHALANGASGLSIALLYPPASDFSAPLLKRLFAVAAAARRPVFAHTRSIGARLRHAVAELLALAVASKARLVIANFKVAGRGAPARWTAVRAMLERAVADGADVWLTYYPYAIASTLLSFARPGLRNGLWPVLHDRTALLRIGANEAVSLAHAAQANREAPRATLERWLADDDGQTMAAYPILDQDVIDRQRAWPRALIASDDDAMPLAQASAATHPRCFGSFARALRLADPAGLPDAIARVTSLSADLLGLADRGRIQRGAAADLAIFGAQGLRDEARYGSPQLATGLSALIVNGVVAVARGKPTGARAGLPI